MRSLNVGWLIRIDVRMYGSPTYPFLGNVAHYAPASSTPPPSPPCEFETRTRSTAAIIGTRKTNQRRYPLLLFRARPTSVANEFLSKIKTRYRVSAARRRRRHPVLSLPLVSRQHDNVRYFCEITGKASSCSNY